MACGGYALGHADLPGSVVCAGEGWRSDGESTGWDSLRS